jgi:hypothetical protein
LALFFDEVALLVPDYMRDRPLALDPPIAEPLQDAGLLRILSPETLVGKDASEELGQLQLEVADGSTIRTPNCSTPSRRRSTSRSSARGSRAQ